MASDLFHDVARAYYGVGPEVYTLANIATHGNAPAGYAMGCEAGEQDQYDVKPMKGQPSLFNKMTESAPPPIAREPSTVQTATAAPAINRKSLQKYNPLAGDLFRAAELLSKKGLHKDAAQAHSGLARYFGALAKNTDDLEAARFAKYHSDQADFHAGQPAPSGTKGYVKPTFAQPETIPDSPGQKHMFTAQDNPDDEEADEEKPDFTETGTGDHVTADEEDYGIMDAAKKAALGAGIAMSAMGSQGQAAEPSGLSIARQYADPSARGLRLQQLQTDANAIRQIGDKYRKPGTVTKGNARNDIDFRISDRQIQRQLAENAARTHTKPTTSPLAPTKAWQRGAAIAGISDKAYQDLSDKDQESSASPMTKPKPPKIDYSLTGTGTKVKVPESKNCAKSGCSKPK